MIGMWRAVSASRLRMVAVAWKPSISGIEQSIRMRSRAFLPGCHGLDTVGGDAAGAAQQAQHAGGHELVGLVVLGDEDAAPADDQGSLAGAARGWGATTQGTENQKVPAVARRAVDADFAAEQTAVCCRWPGRDCALPP